MPYAGLSKGDSRPGRASGAGRVVAKLARSRSIVLPAAAVVTGAALFLAIRLEAELDVKDFFDSSSDFVVGLDKLDQHVGATQGEPGIIYIEGDLSSGESLEALRELQSKLQANPYVTKGIGRGAHRIQLDGLPLDGAPGGERVRPFPGDACHRPGDHGHGRRQGAGHRGPDQRQLRLHRGAWHPARRLHPGFHTDPGSEQALPRSHRT